MNAERATGHHQVTSQQGSRDPAKHREAERAPLLPRSPPFPSPSSPQPAKQLTTHHAFAVLVSLQIGSGIFASPAQVDTNVPSPGAALLVWVLGGLLSWAGAASFAELGAALPLNGGMQEYLRHVFGDTMAFLMAWVYIVAVKPSSMAIQSIVIAESVGSVSGGGSAGEQALSEWGMKLVAALAFVFLVVVNSINTRITMRLSESFTAIKISTVGLIVVGGSIAVIAYIINPKSAFSGASDWHEKNWFHTRPSTSGGQTVDWTSISTWERYGHYCAAIYAGLWAFDGWDNANIVASEIRDPGRALPKAIKAAMVVVLSSYELVNIAYYVLLPWDTMGASNAVAVAAASSLFGRPAGILITLLVGVSCAGSITSNVFAVGRLTVAAAQRHYLPAIFSKRGLFKSTTTTTKIQRPASSPARSDQSPTASLMQEPPPPPTTTAFDAPLPANALSLLLTLIYLLTGSFRALLTFVGMAEWVFYVSTVIGLLVLRRREPHLERPYKPFIALPVVFVVVGILVIVRSAVFAPVQSGVLAGLLVVGGVVGGVRTGRGGSVDE